jgi:uroporphyrinogen III methyltransferase/synthase
VSEGIVYLVGAGPGDPGLITIRARELLDTADAVVYDALVAPELIAALAESPRRPELHDVGKRGARRGSASQDDINTLLIRLARAGKRVVRLKGGDPFVFGRGGEEAQACHEAEVPFEIVPGVTAGLAAAAYAGIPVTHRGRSTSVTLVTGHEDPAKGGGQTNWSALARLAAEGGTLVVYMGARTLGTVVQALRDAGLDDDVPAATISDGTLPHQRTIAATLGTIATAVDRALLGPPLVTVIGWAVLLRDELAWVEQRPLFGKTIVVTRATQQAGTLSARLREHGARVIEMPATRIARIGATAVQEAIQKLGDYSWLIFTSQNAVTVFWEQLLAASRDARVLAGLRIAAVGPATAGALLERGVAVDVLPDRFVAEGLLEALRERSDVNGTRVLYVTAKDARDVLRAGLEEMGASVDVVVAYRSIPDGKGADRLRRELERGGVDLVTVTSAASVHAFVELVGSDVARRAPIASIGRVTSAVAGQLGLEVSVEATESSVDGLVEAIVRSS